jgi:uracil-DNA glycosylase family 4
MASFAELDQAIIACQRCPRLREYCSQVAQTRRAAYAHQEYWGKPVPGFGDPDAWLWIIGLAPGAHGSNRTGRMFTGDRSGDFLYAALHRAGLANQPTSTWRDDGLRLAGVFISAAGRCAPPLNKPAPEELRACRPYLHDERALLPQARAILVLGKVAYESAWSMLREAGSPLPVSRPGFAHGVSFRSGEYQVVASYHVSQQNTFTGKLTPAMFDGLLQSLKHTAE